MLRLRPSYFAYLTSAALLCAASGAAPAHADSFWDKEAEFMTSPGALIYGTAAFVLPLLNDSKSGKKEGLRMADSLLTTSIATEALKRIVREKRPRTDERDSFPSGHASAVFSIASMASHYHPRQAPYWYAGAILISASRVQRRRHHLHDVVAGAALGYGITRLELSRPRGLILSPFIRPDTANSKRAMGLQMTKLF